MGLEGLTAGLQHVPCPGPWQGSEPGQQPIHTPCQGTWGVEHLPGSPQGSLSPQEPKLGQHRAATTCQAEQRPQGPALCQGTARQGECQQCC